MSQSNLSGSVYVLYIIKKTKKRYVCVCFRGILDTQMISDCILKLKQLQHGTQILVIQKHTKTVNFT